MKDLDKGGINFFLLKDFIKYSIENGKKDAIKTLISKITDDVLIVITGKSGAGKTTLRKELEEYGFSPIITSTSRKPRDGEKDGIDYNFIESNQFKDNNFCLVGTNENGEKYGINTNLLIEKGKKVLVTGKGGVDELSDMVKKEILEYKSILLINLDFSNFTLIKRLLKRGDEKENIRKRLTSDNKKFEKFNSDLETINIKNGGIEEVQKRIMYELIERYPISFIKNITNNK